VDGPGAGVTRILDDVTVRLTFAAWLSSALAHRPPAVLSFMGFFLLKQIKIHAL
jgi:hypothetical protein